MSNGNAASTNQALLLVVVTLSLSFALGQILPEDAQPWILITLGTLTIAYITRRFILYSDQGKPIRDYLQRIGKAYYGIALGVFIILIGIMTRFAPTDIGIVLSITGILTLVGSVIYFFNNNKMAALNGVPLAADLTFKERITEEVLQHARRASLLSFSVAVGLFIIGIGIFIFIGISIYQMLGDDTQAFLFSNFTTEFIGRYRASLPDIEMIGILFLIQIVALFPIIGLILIGWLGSKFIISATRLSQRKAIQDTLTEIGPLDAVLAGVSISQPPMESIEKSLQQAQRALRMRKFFSTLLFLAGIGLFSWLITDGILWGFKDVMKITVLGSMGTLFLIISLVLNNARQIRNNLRDITTLQMNIAQQTQRSQIVNLYVAHLAKNGFKEQNAEELKRVLQTLHTVQETDGGT